MRVKVYADANHVNAAKTIVPALFYGRFLRYTWLYISFWGRRIGVTIHA